MFCIAWNFNNYIFFFTVKQNNKVEIVNYLKGYVNNCLIFKLYFKSHEESIFKAM